MRANSTFAVFRNRAFLLLWCAQVVSAAGSALTALGASILIYRLTGSALSVGLILIATSGPAIIVGLVAGVFVDRYDRKRIMVAADLVRAVLIGLIPTLTESHGAWLYVLVALSSAVTQFFESALSSVVPEVAHDTELAAANALLATASVGATTLGFAAAGGLAATFGITWAFYLNAGSFLISAACTLAMRLPPWKPVENTSLGAVGRNLRAGFEVVQSTPALRSLFVLFGPVFVVFGLQNSLALPFLSSALDGTELEFGMLQAAEAVGIALGSLAIIRIADRIQSGQWLTISFLLMSVTSAWFAFSAQVPIAIFLLGLSGVVNAPSYIGRQLVIQRATPRHARGRVNSTFFVLRDLMSVIGMAMAGLADAFGVRPVYLVSSIGLLGAGGLAIALPGIRQPLGQWKRILSLLRGVEAAPRLGGGRPTETRELARFVAAFPELGGMSHLDLDRLRKDTLVAQVPGGKVVVYRDELSDAAFFVLRGSVGVGYRRGDEYVILNYLGPGEWFGEVAALTGSPRTATVITEEETELLVIPAGSLRRLAARFDNLRGLLLRTITERLSAMDVSVAGTLDQESLRELRADAVE